MNTERIEAMCGGKGHVLIKHILGESETYYILTGEGNYDDNGRIRPVKAGDVTFTPDGCGHALTNTGDTDLVFMALIIKD